MSTQSLPDQSLRAEYREVARARIVEAAIPVFKAKGYAQASIVELARAAGLSRGTFYSRFPAKSDLLRELALDASTRYTGRYSELAALFASGTEAQLRLWLTTAFAGWADIADLMRPVYEALDADPGLAPDVLGGSDPSGATEVSAVLISSGLVTDQERANALSAVLMAPLMHFFREYLRGGEFSHPLAIDAVLPAWSGVLRSLRTDF